MDAATENVGLTVVMGDDPNDLKRDVPIKRIESALLAHANGRWEEAKQSRSVIEEDLLDSLRRRRGVYSDAKLAEIRKQGGSEVYMQLTGIKCRAAAAWIKNVLFQPGERMFSVDPTPLPYEDDMIETVVQQILAEAQQAGIEADADQVRSEIEQNHTKDMQERMQKMEDKIADQLAEGGFEDALQEFIDDLTTYKTAFLKGPIIRQRVEEKWRQGEGGWELVREPVLVKEWARVSPFDMFPAPDAKRIDESWLIERHRVSRKELRSYIGVPGYDADAIEAVIGRYGESGLEDYVSGDQARERLETSTSNQAYQSETIEGFELWDSVPGSMLIRWDGGRGLLGDAQIEPFVEYDVNVWVIGSHIIKVDIADDSSLARPYYAASYDTVPGSIWGKSIPEIMRDVQDVCNGCARALVNNMAIASGPQVGINVDKVPAGEAITAMHPWKHWQFNGDMAGAISFFSPDSHASELMKIYEYFSSKADEYTGIPAFAYGQSEKTGAGATASGLSMLISSASNGIKAVIGHIDRNVIEPAVRRMYHFNMMHDDDESIKGDAKVVAMGAKSLIVKEQMQTKRMAFMQQTANPMDMQIIGLKGRAELLRETAKALDLPHDLVPSDKEIEQEAQQQAQAQQQQVANAPQ